MRPPPLAIQQPKEDVLSLPHHLWFSLFLFHTNPPTYTQTRAQRHTSHDF